MATPPQNVLDLVNSLVHAYPTGLPDGIHININLDFNVSQDTSGGGTTPTDPPAPTPQVYKGPFLGLYRVVASNETKRIKVRSDCDPTAPETSVRIESRHLAFIHGLNPAKPAYLETNGYIYETTGSQPKMYYKQFAFDGQLVVVAETRKIGKTTMGRIIGIGSDPMQADPKPLDAAVTNNSLTPWLVHQIPGINIYAPILASDGETGWVSMDELQKIK